MEQNTFSKLIFVKNSIRLTQTKYLSHSQLSEQGRVISSFWSFSSDWETPQQHSSQLWMTFFMISRHVCYCLHWRNTDVHQNIQSPHRPRPKRVVQTQAGKSLPKSIKVLLWKLLHWISRTYYIKTKKFSHVGKHKSHKCLGYTSYPPRKREIERSVIISCPNRLVQNMY